MARQWLSGFSIGLYPRLIEAEKGVKIKVVLIVEMQGNYSVTDSLDGTPLS